MCVNFEDNLLAVGGVKYTNKEKIFAEQIYKTLRSPDKEISSAGEVQSYKFTTDVGDVSWMVPTAGLRSGTWTPGTSAHTWQAVAVGGYGHWHERDDECRQNHCRHGS